ncbi:putative iron-sulfur cluster assembly associated protein Nar1 [Eremomyces bilateralis CBS 781.70]|uniref:Nuclear architecture-related protein 1 n=1 Tax=Eremomyces bilateralis CBS 781.70 TaxID=1392243 RepID=A0A6G1GGF1_9PEZI|nr:putative iron-sulfur cluster assembly associated protein Nar1 [Eremomyces bilateralis CBS 781.70]KAF1817072.1 putative iron-sulfur cluster assembly associated protein Nar1 [Eremomyces bilateralis CBS 781.70]
MSAILSADDLNDFISPGVACIKPIESIPAEKQNGEPNPYEVTTEDKVAAANPTPAQISLTDCLACSGCVTSAEAILVSLQSHQEVLDTLDANPSLDPSDLVSGSRTAEYHDHTQNGANGVSNGVSEGKLFVASVSPQAKASIAAAHGISFSDAGHLIEQLLSGPNGVKTGGKHHSSFAWVIDTNALRSASLVLAYEEANSATSTSSPKRPVLASACPGWICYAEKTHPQLLPNLSAVKSPQSLSGALLKSVLSRAYGIPPSQIWHLAVMPCFDKKLEASRGELTSDAWAPDSAPPSDPVRDVDCVITPRELLQVASLRNLNFATLPPQPVTRPRFPDPTLSAFLFPPSHSNRGAPADPTGTSGGFLSHIAKRVAASTPGSRIRVDRGRNADVLDIVVEDRDGRTAWKGMRCYGFRNIQNLVRKMKPKTNRLLGARKAPVRKREGDAAPGSEYAYVEVMACPGGCTNGGGQIRVTELQELGLREGDAEGRTVAGPKEQREWLAKVDEAYFSAESDSEEQRGTTANGDAMEIDPPTERMTSNGHALNGQAPVDASDVDADVVDGISRTYILSVLDHWTSLTGVPIEKLAFTTYRKVESDVGKDITDTQRVAGLASTIGGGW